MVTHTGIKVRIEGKAALFRLHNVNYTNVQKMNEDLDKVRDLIIYNLEN